MYVWGETLDMLRYFCRVVQTFWEGRVCFIELEVSLQARGVCACADATTNEEHGCPLYLLSILTASIEATNMFQCDIHLI